MTDTYVQQYAHWSGKPSMLSFVLEITARCTNNCKHCYINLPAADRQAQRRELTLAEIERLAGEAAALGAIHCLISGGEPLLRPDFADIYLLLKKKGFLVSVYTSATLVTDAHVRLFQGFPPRNIEVTVYGVTEATYECVTRKPGSFRTFKTGLERLLEGGIKVRLKAMALRSNAAELAEIARFCRERTKDYFRFDPLLHLRFDRDPVRNNEIRDERLWPAEIVALEHADHERLAAMKSSCHTLIVPEFAKSNDDRLFGCAAGTVGFDISYDGTFRLCSALWHSDCTYDLRNGTLADAWRNLVPRIRAISSSKPAFVENCRTCPIVNLCLWCPAHADLETGELDGPVPYFCAVAHARAEALRAELPPSD